MKISPKISLLSSVALAALCLGLISTAFADPFTTPTGTTFGPLVGATFGGSGIPNSAVQITQVGSLTLGLSAHGRYANPNVTNTGDGNFQATAGGDTLDSTPTYARWNFDFYIKGLTNGQSVQLFFDKDPTIGNDVATAPFGAFTSDYQDSWNLGMGFLGGGLFDPELSGQYAFALVAYDATGGYLGTSSILVNVNGGRDSVPDGGSMALMLGSSIVGLALLRRRFAK